MKIVEHLLNEPVDAIDEDEDSDGEDGEDGEDEDPEGEHMVDERPELPRANKRRHGKFRLISLSWSKRLSFVINNIQNIFHIHSEN